ncbi:hypothetical protein OIU77_012285 [Salix suchowensis]|uniref:Peptidyl-prolyl cis-trans isomerase n=1 Tax=Salix suchowensis TaxID=1278906 RepID=A0ABQ9A385_9ROSI|nr:hypothetical protein OIU77_012285 [Salix suchowensis]
MVRQLSPCGHTCYYLQVCGSFPSRSPELTISPSRVRRTQKSELRSGDCKLKWERTRSQKTLERRQREKGKQAGGGSEENVSKGKGKSGKASDGLGTCTYVKARHILCEKQGKINEAYQKLQDGWLSNGDKVPPAEFAKVASEYSECPSGKKGGDLGWFPRGKMAGPFQDVAFATPIGATSAPFKSTHGYHIILSEGRKN